MAHEAQAASIPLEDAQSHDPDGGLSSGLLLSVTDLPRVTLKDDEPTTGTFVESET